MGEEQREQLPLAEAVTHILEECRMVLPGIQALFGFQLIAVINSGFSEKLSPSEQKIHLMSICMVALAVALVMAPAAYHRQYSPMQVSTGFMTIATKLLICSMVPLMFGICLDFYLIANMILHSQLPSLLLSLLLLICFSLLWFVLPRVSSRTS